MTEITIKYYPHKGQLPFHEARYKVSYRAIFGGTGSGKTAAGVFEDLSWLLENPGIVGYVFEPTYPMVKRILIPTLEHFIGFPLDSSPLVSNFNRGDLRLDLVNGSHYWMGSLDDPERAEGPNIDFIHLDEARLIRDFQTAWQVCRRRLRGSGGNYPIGAWVTTTPDAPGSSLYNFFEHPEKRDPESAVYRMRLEDNAANLPAGYVEAVKRAHTGGLYKRFVEGLFAEVAGGSFSFDYTKHILKEMPKTFTKVVGGIDFGWQNPSAIIAVGFDGDGRAYVLDEFYESQVNQERLIAEALEFQTKYGIEQFYCDASEPGTIDALRRGGVNARANVSKREDGIRELGGRFLDAGDGRFRIYVAPSCVNLIEELQVYDAERKEHDHAVDACRYGIVGGRFLEGGIVAATGRRPR